MLTTLIQEKLAGWARERDEIQNRIAALKGEKREAVVAVKAALKEKNTDGIIAARQVEVQLDQEIEALNMIAAENSKAPPVDHETFMREYGEFYAQQMQILGKAYRDIADRLTKLESDSYYNYDHAYQQYVMQMKSWQDLAVKIGIAQPGELRSQVLNPAHNDIKKAISRLRVTGGL